MIFKWYELASYLTKTHAKITQNMSRQTRSLVHVILKTRLENTNLSFVKSEVMLGL